MKKCTHCKEEKELDKFGPHAAAKDKLFCYCKDCARAVARQRYYNKKETILPYIKEWQKNNPQKWVNATPHQKTAHELNKKLKQFLNKTHRLKIHSKLFDCNVLFLKEYISKQFTPEMTWENYKTYWVVDHIKPLSLFDLSDKAQWPIASHYTNLRPIEKTLNNQRSKPRKNWPEELIQAAIKDKIDRSPPFI